MTAWYYCTTLLPMEQNTVLLYYIATDIIIQYMYGQYSCITRINNNAIAQMIPLHYGWHEYMIVLILQSSTRNLSSCATPLRDTSVNNWTDFQNKIIIKKQKKKKKVRGKIKIWLGIFHNKSTEHGPAEKCLEMPLTCSWASTFRPSVSARRTSPSRAACSGFGRPP